MASFTLDTSVLSGTDLQYVEAILNERGRSISIDWTQSGSNQNIEVHGYALRVVPTEQVAMEPS